MNRYVVGDIHGCYDSLIDVLSRANFKDGLDTLYSVGDFCDRGTQNYQTLKYLMSLKSFSPVIGNHDWWLYQYLKTEIEDHYWMTRTSYDCWTYNNNGIKTVKELSSLSFEEKQKIYNWLKNIPYRREIDSDKILIHTPVSQDFYDSMKPFLSLDEITLETLDPNLTLTSYDYDTWLWSREVIRSSKQFESIEGNKGLCIGKYDQEFNKKNPLYIIGHTVLSKPFYDRDMNILAIDTGPFCNMTDYGVEGCLTLINLDTFEYWQSYKEGVFNL